MIFEKYFFGRKFNIQFIKELNSIINSKSKILFLFCIFSSALTCLIDLTFPISLYNLFKVIEEQDNTDLKGEIACSANGCEIV